MIEAGKKGKIVIMKGWPGFNWLDRGLRNLPYEELLARARKNITFPLAVLRSPHQTKPKYTPACYSLFLTVGHSKRCYPFYSAKNAEILLYLINFLVLRNFFVDRLV